MSRVERKKQEKLEKIERKGILKTMGKLMVILAVFYMLFIGVIVVDETSRAMMMTEEPKVFEHKTLNKNIHEITLCGTKLFVDEQEVRNTIELAKRDMKTAYQFVTNEIGSILQAVENKLSERLK